MAKKKTKSSKRGAGFCEDELDCLLDTLDKHLPIGKEEWDRTTAEHLTMYPEQARTVESIRRKFATLYRKKMPTGDPNCPEPVRRAKRIHVAINQKAELSDGHDDSSDDEVSDGHDPELDALLQDMPSLEPSDANDHRVLSNLNPFANPGYAGSLSVSSTIAAAANVSATSSSTSTRSQFHSPSASSTIAAAGANVSSTSSSTSTRSQFRSFPSVSRRQKVSPRASAPPKTDSFSEFMQYSIMQRELDRQDRDRDRAEERERRAEENRMMQQMFMYAIAGSAATNNKVDKVDKDDKDE